MKNVFLIGTFFSVFQMVSLSTFGMEEVEGFSAVRSVASASEVETTSKSTLPKTSSQKSNISENFSRFREDREIASLQISNLHMNAQLMDAELRKRMAFMSQLEKSRDEEDRRRSLFSHYQGICNNLQEIIREFEQLKTQNDPLLQMDPSTYKSHMDHEPSQTSPWKAIDLRQADLTRRYVHLQSQHQLTEYEEASEQLRKTQQELLDVKTRLIDALGREQALKEEASKQQRALTMSLETSARAPSSASDLSLVLSRSFGSHEVQSSGASATSSGTHPSFEILGSEYADPKKPLVMNMFFYIHNSREYFQETGTPNLKIRCFFDSPKILRHERAINQRLLLCMERIASALNADPTGRLVYKTSKEPAELEMLTVVLDFYRRFFSIRTKFLEDLEHSKTPAPCCFLKFDKNPEENAEIKKIAQMFGNLIQLLHDIHPHYMEISVPIDAQISHEIAMEKMLGNTRSEGSLDLHFRKLNSQLSDHAFGKITLLKGDVKEVLRSTLKDFSHEEVRAYLPAEYLEPMEYLKGLQQELLAQTSVGKASFSTFFTPAHSNP